MIYIAAVVALLVVGGFGWKLTSRNAYESASYSVLESDDAFEIREYPDLNLAITQAEFDSQGDDGSFMRLFRYIDGNNAQQQKVAMTTPVFMNSRRKDVPGQMGFVIPQKLKEGEIPNPDNAKVQLSERKGGQFAVIRFSGRMNEETVRQAEQKLRAWAAKKDLRLADEAEYAGYDPPWTPGPFRRNEVHIRLSQSL
ncbi:SOUL family heme-binding protein [Gimesia panareensis]|uniref:SOUL family heme-binding protein n=1 Tax=Gimesia panareensis TaxID=2527978 RepID=UPI00118AB25D|nr:heme-binding protein [Gimesia panareensis]QDU47719.1 SOUL heme-binding protein [Gimesia panareensis]